jgi:hypothetical protein
MPQAQQLPQSGRKETIRSMKLSAMHTRNFRNLIRKAFRR